MITILKPDFVFEDERGRLTQLVREGFSQFNIVCSKKGVLRGEHYHKENREAFYVISGSFRLVVKERGVKEEYVFRAGDMFLVPPNVVHSFYYLEDSVVAGLYDIGVEKADGSKDIYTEVSGEGESDV